MICIVDKVFVNIIYNRLRTFDSGVLVIESSSVNEGAVIENTLEKVIITLLY